MNKMENEKLLPTNGELMSLQDFILYCGEGTYFDTDGIGYYSDGRVFWLDQEARPSDMVRFKISHNTKHRYVIWFKK
jgi:hypothetical protein